MSLETMNITTERYNLLMDERERLRVAHEAAIVREGKLKADLTERDTQIEIFKQGVKRQALGILKLAGLTRDDLLAWIIKQEEKGKV